MLAEQNSDLEEAVVTMYEMTAEEAIREQCRAREDYYRTINTFKTEIQNRENALEELNRQLAMKDHQLEQQARQIEAQSKEIEAQGKEIESQSKKVETQGRQITELSQQLDTLMKLSSHPFFFHGRALRSQPPRHPPRKASPHQTRKASYTA